MLGGVTEHFSSTTITRHPSMNTENFFCINEIQIMAIFIKYVNSSLEESSKS